MQASQATNETRLPRQVLKRSAEIQARLDAERAAREPETPPTEGAPTGVTPTPPADPAPPAADPREQDPAYWRHRFGFGVGNRLSAVVTALNGTSSYTIPTAYQ